MPTKPIKTKPMKALYTLILSCFYIGLSWSQNTADIVSLEYFFDQDPGVGLGTSIDIDPDAETINQSFNISTSGLPSGTHTLFLRALNANGKASIAESKTFRVAPSSDNNTADIVEAEYYFDQDPGIGNGTVIDLVNAANIDETVAISTTGLSPGTHHLFVRTKNSANAYSLYEHKTFRVAPAADNNTSDIVEAEYYFDQDPGVGNGTAIDLVDATSIDEAIAVSTTGLSLGTHHLFVRTKNSANVYSLYEHKSFRVAPAADNNMSDIVEAEYYFDQDPGVGNGTVIDLVDAASIDEAVTVSTIGLTTGIHQLFIRVKNSNNEYSLYEHKVFRIAPTPDVNSASIVAAEYFIDIDPGLGNANSLNVSGDSLDDDLTITTLGSLAQGDHYLFIRVLNADNTWSLYEAQYFEISGTLGIPSEDLSHIKIFPNPTSSYLSIDLPNQTEIESLQVIDMTGKVVLKTHDRSQTLDVTQLSNGVYLLQVKTNYGTLSKRIIKN